MCSNPPRSFSYDQGYSLLTLAAATGMAQKKLKWGFAVAFVTARRVASDHRCAPKRIEMKVTRRAGEDPCVEKSSTELDSD
jgi:hypothetical protein